MEQIKEQIKHCLRDKPAGCMQACYFNLNIRDFTARVQRGRFDAALRMLRDAVAFPGIVAALCDAPCQEKCSRGAFDNAVQLHYLEQAVLQHAKNTPPSRYNVAAKEGRVGIVGGGISGLACAVRLASRKYAVTVIEQTHRIGGHLHDRMPSEVLLDEIHHEFQQENWELRLNCKVEGLEELDFDAIYIATGQGGDCFGLSHQGQGPLPTERSGVFVGGSLLGCNSMQAIHHGLQAANSIEAYLKTGRMDTVKTERSSGCVQVGTDRFQPMEFIQGGAFSPQQATQEAKRCIQCNCDTCKRNCDLMAYYDRFPKRVMDEVDGTLHPSCYEANHISTRLIASCDQCGICKEACPMGIDMQRFLLESRREMVRQGNMPQVYSAFWLEDMAHADGEDAALLQLPDGQDSCQYVFFPGCHLGASDPGYVRSSYDALRRIDGSTGLLLRCCAAPAHWAGEVVLHSQMVAQIRSQWEEMGMPIFIFACTSCKKMFSEFLPEIEGVSLYERLMFLPAESMASGHGETVSVFDPCSSRGEPELQRAVRYLLERAGYVLSPLPKEMEHAQCCSFGGQTAIANPGSAQKAIAQRISQSPNPYAVYCANCRDIFATAGKNADHILGLLLGIGNFERAAPTWSQRRQNREKLKSSLTPIHQEEECVVPCVEIARPLQQKISDAYLLEEDCIQTLLHCEQSGQKIYDSEKDAFTGHLLIGYMTHWVEYRPTVEGFVLLNAYAHRLQIQGG